MKSPLLISRRDSRGSVLIVVMIVCLGLVAMALTFGHSMLMAYRGADNDIAGRQAEEAVESGVRYAEYLISNVEHRGDMPDPDDYQAEALTVGEATFWFIGAPDSSGSSTSGFSMSSVSTSGSSPNFGLIDEASKLNLNTATQDMLLALPGMSTDLAAAIVQWRNTNSDATASSGDVSFTIGAVKNAPFESVEELALLTGSDSTILYGQDANLNHIVDPWEADAPQAQVSSTNGSTSDTGFLDYVTVFTREPELRTDGTARINVTARPVPPALNPLLTNIVGSGSARTIVAAITRDPPVRSVLEFAVRAGLPEDLFTRLAPDLRGSRLQGLVNVNTASQTVLAAIPGIGVDKASQIIAARANRTQPSTGLLWVVPLLGPDGLTAAGPWLTGMTYQICADVAAVGRNGRGYRRTQFIVDTAAGAPRIIYRRNLASLGWALGGDARDAVASNQQIQ